MYSYHVEGVRPEVAKRFYDILGERLHRAALDRGVSEFHLQGINVDTLRGRCVAIACIEKLAIQ